MPTYSAQVIDANLNRVSEGLRVIEEYCRFILKHKIFTDQLASIRKIVNESEQQPIEHLQIRETEADMRAKETPRARESLFDLLKANFKRVEEGLRVLEEYTGQPMYSIIRYDIYALEKDILLTLSRKNILKGIYLISDQVEILRQGLEWGVRMIQLRDKTGSKQAIYDKAKILQKLALKSGIPFIVNDHLDIAKSVDADGLHSGQDDLPVSVQRQLLGPHKIIGRTTHTLEQGLQAQSDGADYISVGPIWETPSKPGRSGIGLDYLTHARERFQIPYVAIGGVSLDRMPLLMTYPPPLIGLIRAWKEVPQFIAAYNKFV